MLSIPQSPPLELISGGAYSCRRERMHSGCGAKAPDHSFFAPSGGDLLV